MNEEADEEEGLQTPEDKEEKSTDFISERNLLRDSFVVLIDLLEEIRG